MAEVDQYGHQQVTARCPYCKHMGVLATVPYHDLDVSAEPWPSSDSLRHVPSRNHAAVQRRAQNGSAAWMLMRDSLPAAGQTFASRWREMEGRSTRRAN